MNDYKLLLARCSKHNKRFCLELKKNGTQFEVVNFLQVSEQEATKIPAEHLSTGLKTATNLLACYKCGSRNVASCNCAAKHNRCSAKDVFNFQCVYCEKLILDKPVKKDQKIYVSSPMYDNIGLVLNSLKIPYSPYKNKFDCDLLFINCGTSDKFDSKQLAAFVENGGCAYISDLASSILDAAFPGIMRFSNSGRACKVQADVLDDELRQIAGKTVEIEFDLGSWSIITDYSGLSKYDGKVLLRAGQGNDYTGRPVMVSFQYGKGKVFYTSFHNHTQASEKEKMLLQLLLLKQMSSNANQSLEQIGSLMGLNLSSMKKKFQQ